MEKQRCKSRSPVGLVSNISPPTTTIGEGCSRSKMVPKGCHYYNCHNIKVSTRSLWTRFIDLALKGSWWMTITASIRFTAFWYLRWRWQGLSKRQLWRYRLNQDGFDSWCGHDGNGRSPIARKFAQSMSKIKFISSLIVLYAPKVQLSLGVTCDIDFSTKRQNYPESRTPTYSPFQQRR